MMDVLLVNPRYNGRSEIPPLGLVSLAALLLEKDMKVSILDLDVLPEEEAGASLKHALVEERPAIVGVTSLSDSFKSAMEICRAVKCQNTDTLTVLGGVHATVLSGAILDAEENLDMVVRGEGENTFCELAGRMLKGLDPKGVDGVSFREGGKIIHNPDRDFEQDLDLLPMPAHHLLENRLYWTRSISSSRGCVHNCTFCSIQSLYHHRVRMRSTEGLIREIKLLVSLGAGRIMFTDDNFTFSLKRIRDLCKGIKDEGFAEKIEFYAEGRMDDICRNPIMAQILSGAGFRAIYAGAESGSSKIQKYYRKGHKPDDILRGVSVCVEQNLTPVVNFILMGPRDTTDTILETISLAKRAFENGAEIAYAETLIPYPGTPVHEELVKDGKYREKGSVFYFESYEGMKLDWFLQLCDVAREITEIIHAGEKYYQTKKAYYEMSNLEDMLKKRTPVAFQKYLAREAGEAALGIERRMGLLLS
jgi:anaerobic magnesium-protoporphyrin IX monomethyl ester cyclase